MNDPIPMQQLAATRFAAAASLAAGMIAATGRGHSPREAADLAMSCYHALFPEHGRGTYEQWVREGAEAKKHE